MKRLDRPGANKQTKEHTMENKNNMPAKNYAIMSDKDLVVLARKKDDRAIEALYFRHRDRMVRAAIYHFRKYPFSDVASFNKLSFKDKELQLQSEIFIALSEAIRDFDFKSCAFCSHVNNKIKWRFMQLYRQNMDKVCHECSIDKQRKKNYDDSFDPADYLQYEQARQIEKDDEFDSGISEILDVIMHKVPMKKIERDVIRAMYEAMKMNHPNPVPYAANAVKRSRQQVYNILENVHQSLPSKLAQAFYDLF